MCFASYSPPPSPLTVAVSRKSEFTLAPLFPNKKQPTPTLSGMSLSRRLSFGKNRPFLHQYEVKGQPDVATHAQPSSAPTTPVKAKGGGFKRSLSFGGGVNPRKAQIARGGDGNCGGERMEPIPVTKGTLQMISIAGCDLRGSFSIEVVILFQGALFVHSLAKSLVMFQ